MIVVAILSGAIMGVSIVMICWTLAKMFCRWAFAGEKLPKQSKSEMYSEFIVAQKERERKFKEQMQRYKELEYNNSLNDN